MYSKTIGFVLRSHSIVFGRYDRSSDRTGYSNGLKCPDPALANTAFSFYSLLNFERSIMTSSSQSKTPPSFKQAFLAKTFHWINIISLLLMMTSGLQIYNANPVFGGRGGWEFPSFFLLGGWLAGGRHWHFAAMWLYALNLLWYGLYVFATNRWQRRFASANDLKALQIENSKRKNYAWHRLIYTAIIPILLLAILSGLAMYKPAQFYWLSNLFGNWQSLRVVHLFTVPAIIVFTMVHSLLALKVGSFRLIKSMFV